MTFNNKLDSFKFISTANNALKNRTHLKIFFLRNGVSSTENLTQFLQYIFAIRQVFFTIYARHINVNGEMQKNKSTVFTKTSKWKWNAFLCQILDNFKSVFYVSFLFLLLYGRD